MATPALQAVPATATKELLQLVEKQISFQQRWRCINMGFCVMLTITAIGSASAASVIAALAHSVWGAGLSGLAGCCLSAERALLLREKWKLHVGTKSALESLKAKILCSTEFNERMLEQFAEIMHDYAEELPVIERRTS